MKKISLGLLMTALLAGCSTSKHYDFVAISQPGVDQDTFKEMAKPFCLYSGSITVFGNYFETNVHVGS